MNRSILIVICDFIVSAMLTMIAGMSDAPSSSVGGGVPLDNRAAAMVLEEVRREVPDLGETDLAGGLAASGADGVLQHVAYRNPATGFDVRVEFLARPDRLRVNGRELAFPSVSESEAVVFSPETGTFARQNAEDRLTFPGKAVY